MKKIIFVVALVFLPLIAIAHKPNLDKLLEKERNEYLLKTAYETVMKHAPEWYSDYKESVIVSGTINLGPNKGRMVYSVRYLSNPRVHNVEYLEYGYSVGVGFWADTGEVSALGFGDGEEWSLKTPPSTRSGEQAKPLYRPNPYLKKNKSGSENEVTF